MSLFVRKKQASFKELTDSNLMHLSLMGKKSNQIVNRSNVTKQEIWFESRALRYSRRATEQTDKEFTRKHYTRAYSTKSWYDKKFGD